MNLEKPYLNKEICFLEWLDEFSKKRLDYRSVQKNFLYNVSLLPLYKKEQLYNEAINPKQYINLHAHWCKTPQGHAYWRLLECEWKAFLSIIEKYEDHPNYKVKKIFIDYPINTIKKIKVKFEGD